MIKKYLNEIALVGMYVIFIIATLEASLSQEFKRSILKMDLFGQTALIYTAYLGTKILVKKTKMSSFKGAFIGVSFVSVGIILSVIFLNIFNSYNRIQNSFNFSFLFYMLPLAGLVGYFTKKRIGVYIPILFWILSTIWWYLIFILKSG